MAKFLIAFLITAIFLWGSADVGAHGGIPVPHAAEKRIGPIVLKKKVKTLKVPANSCIVSGGEPGQILEQYVLQCTNRRDWLKINFVNKEGSL